MGSVLSSCLFKVNILNLFLHVKFWYGLKWKKLLTFQLIFDKLNAWVEFILTISLINWVQKVIWIMIYYIHVFETAFLKKVFNSSAIFWSYFITFNKLYIQTMVSFIWEKRLNSLPKSKNLSFTNDRFRRLKNFFLSFFIQPTTKVFLLFEGI